MAFGLQHFNVNFLLQENTFYTDLDNM